MDRRLGNYSKLAFVSTVIIGCSYVVQKTLSQEILNKDPANAQRNQLENFLRNLSNVEKELMSCIEHQDYANLVNIIDEIQKNVCDENLNLFAIQPLKIYSLTGDELEILRAYKNATIYKIIRGLWIANTEYMLPQVDQLAVMEYQNDKLQQERENQNIFSKLWALIKRVLGIYPRKDPCYAREPECVGFVLQNLSEEEQILLNELYENDSLGEISNFIEKKLQGDPTKLEEYRQWKADNVVPTALKRIITDLTQAQKRAIEKLRRLNLRSKLKDYYRGRIETMNATQQKDIENFAQRMNATFARCFNPREVQHKTKRRLSFYAPVH